MNQYDIYCKKLYFLLKEIITKSKAEGLLLSGGLDSSIIASIQKPKFTFTVTLEGHDSDKKYAKLIAEKYGSTHITITINYNELIEIEKKVIELFKTFDPIFIRNSSVIFAALQQASEMQIDHVLTGDGSDELFAGYNYLKRYYLNKKELEFQVKRLWDIMSFPSQIIGNFFNIRVSSPYLDEKFLEFAKSLDISLKINKYQNKIWGKFILRKCFQRWENLEDFAWRTKQAQEEGSGFSNITSYFENHGFSNKEYLNNIRRIKETENVNIRNKEHLFYYLSFRKHFPPPKLQRDSIHNKICPDCNCSFKWSGQFCKICGAYPVEPLNNQE